jgi:SAM-dependent MidA family methyltransferase
VTLREKIEQEIRTAGPIPFSRYMAMCLYDPDLGYYSRNAEQFGKAGDFYTSSDVHAVYGRLLARQFEEMWRALDHPNEIQIVELGPGRGLFAQDVLDWAEKKFPEFFRAVRYVLVESSPALRSRLQTRFANRTNAEVHEALHDGLFAGDAIVFANEFFDAFPVEVVSSQGTLHVAAENGRLLETFRPSAPEIAQYIAEYSVRPQGRERVEAALDSFATMARISAEVRRGFVMVVDYGYTQAEQIEGRHRDTVMTYRQHSASANPYAAPGEQDITAHVNFTALTAAARSKGMHVEPLVTQSQFLLGIGESTQFADAFEECVLPQEHAKVALQLKHLVTPAGMGETFHVLVASRGVDSKRVQTLSGQSFSRSRL